MAQGRLPIPGSTSQMQGSGDGGTGRQCGNGKGGKLRLSRLLFRKKPYDRPPDADALLRRRVPQASSLPARLVDSASNLLASSASYLFESFFKRRQVRWIGNGSPSAAERGSEDAVQADELKPPSEHDRQPIVSSPQDPSRQKEADEDAEFLEVEEFLKRQSLSRDDVKRLTKVLQTRVNGGSPIAPDFEGDSHRNAIIQASKESSPAQLAKSYMGRRMPPQWQSTPSRLHGGIGPFSREIFDYGAKESSLEASRRKVAPGTSRFLKRRLNTDEDDIVLTVPARRVRQKISVTANSSPYIRQITAAAGRPQTPSLEPKKPTDKTEKSVEPLEGFLLTSKGKSMEDPSSVLSPNGDVDVPESSKARDRVPSAEKDPYPLLTSGELAEPSFVEPVPALIASSSPPEMAVSSVVSEPSSEVPTSTAKGFHINAFFEDSSSDEEPIPPKKPSLLSGAQASNLMVSNEELLHSTTASKVEQDDTVKGPCAVALDKSPRISEGTFAKVPVSVVQQPNGSTGPSRTNQDSPPVVSMGAQEPFNPAPIGSTTGTPAFSLPSLKPPSQESHLPLWAEKKMDSESRSSSRLPPSTFPTFKSPLKATLSVPQAEAGRASVSFSPLETTIGNDSANKEAAKVKTEEIQIPDRPALKAENAAANIVIPAVVPKISTAAESSAGFVSPSPLFGVAPGSTPLTPASTPPTPEAMPAVPQGGMSETQSTNSNATRSPLDNGGMQHSPMFESPSAEIRQSDMDNMATDPMTEELDGSVGVPAASGSLFGSISNTASASTGENVSFGSRTSISPFSFPMQSSTTSGVSQSPFSNHSIGSSGQLFSYGMSAPSTIANPFSGATQSSFLFGSSAAPSTTSIFPATSSAPLTFPAISPAPSPFLFGAQASSLSSNDSSSIFCQPTQSASGFTVGTAQNNTSTFSFQAPPSTSAPSSIQFGVANAGTASSSAPLFGGQNFGFGVQPPSNTPANPFAQSGGSSTSPFQFGAASATASQPTASNFSFGAQPAASAFSFTFGAQTAPPPTEQSFAFGGQPAAPAHTPFNLPGSTGQGAPGGPSGMEFPGGFSLGAAGGEKSGRKIFKAKRIGGAKRGK